MKILIVNLNLLEKIGQEYYTNESWFRIPIKIAAQMKQVTLMAAVYVHEKDSDIPSSDKWRLNPGKLRVEDFDPCYSYATYYRQWFQKISRWKKQTAELVKDHDVIVLRAPSPNICTIAKCARRYKKPLVLIFPNNMETSSSRIVGNQGLTRLFFRVLAKIIIFQDKFYSRYADTIYIYSKELSNRFGKNNPKVKFSMSPQISMEDFADRVDTCQSSEFRLLRVGWLSPTKGLEYLFQAIALLVSKGFRLKLEIVGKENQSFSYQSKLEKLGQTLNIREHIHFAGWIPYDHMHYVYLGNDIQIISSISEGIPRCITEGAARGLPLVSTDVGGCSNVLTHEKNALLVPPKDAQALADAIERVIHDKGLRKNLIKGGYEVARSASFEKLGMALLDDIRKLVPGK